MELNALCAYDKDYLLVGMQHYYLGILKYIHEENRYIFYKQSRLEKAHNIEGSVLLIERIQHMPQWFIAMTFRSFRILKITQEQDTK